jgi:hypothetical protein
MKFSKTTGGFYTEEIHGDAIPADAVEITAAEHAALLEGQSQGQRIVADADGLPVLADPLPPTAEQIREAAKSARAVAVAAITVTTASGKTFDGDEKSQDRMARAILALQASGAASTLWVLADNTPTTVTAAELGEALALAGAAQSAVWVIP